MARTRARRTDGLALRRLAGGAPDRESSPSAASRTSRPALARTSSAARLRAGDCRPRSRRAPPAAGSLCALRRHVGRAHMPAPAPSEAVATTALRIRVVLDGDEDDGARRRVAGRAREHRGAGTRGRAPDPAPAPQGRLRARGSSDIDLAREAGLIASAEDEESPSAAVLELVEDRLPGCACRRRGRRWAAARRRRRAARPRLRAMRRARWTTSAPRSARRIAGVGSATSVATSIGSGGVRFDLMRGQLLDHVESVYHQRSSIGSWSRSGARWRTACRRPSSRLIVGSSCSMAMTPS